MQENICRLKIKRWKTIFNAQDPKTSRDRLKLIRDTKKTHILMKALIQQEKITFINIYTPNTEVHSFIKQTILNLKYQ